MYTQGRPPDGPGKKKLQQEGKSFQMTRRGPCAPIDSNPGLFTCLDHSGGSRPDSSVVMNNNVSRLGEEEKENGWLEQNISASSSSTQLPRPPPPCITTTLDALQVDRVRAFSPHFGAITRNSFVTACLRFAPCNKRLNNANITIPKRGGGGVIIRKNGKKRKPGGSGGNHGALLRSS